MSIIRRSKPWPKTASYTPKDVIQVFYKYRGDHFDLRYALQNPKIIRWAALAVQTLRELGITQSNQMEEYVQLQFRVCKVHYLSILCGDKAKERWQSFLPSERMSSNTSQAKALKLLAYLTAVEEEVSLNRFPERLYGSHPLWAWLKGYSSKAGSIAAKEALKEFGRKRLLSIYKQAQETAKEASKNTVPFQEMSIGDRARELGRLW